MPSTKANIEPVEIAVAEGGEVDNRLAGCRGDARQKKATQLTAEMTIAIVTGQSSETSPSRDPSSSAYSSAPRKPAMVTRPT